MSGGELFEKVSDDTNRMSEQEAINYMRQVCEGLQHMHENNIVHLDLKPENIMFTTKKSNDVKLIDFGLAAKVNPRDIIKISTGTPEFAAPEIVDQEPIGFYTDMWAAGVLSYVLLSGLSPFGADSDVETLRNVKACHWDFEPEAFKDISDEGKDFIKRLLCRQPEARMTVHECLEHPWLRGDIKATDRLDQRIPSTRYTKIRDQIRKKYDAWPEPNPALGRIANYSSLRKHRPVEYHIKDVSFGKRMRLIN